MNPKKLISLQVGVVLLSLNQNAISCETQSCDVTLTEIALPVMLGTSMVAPFLAGYSYISSDIALASAGFNTYSLAMPFINTWVSWHMKNNVKKGSFGGGQTCGTVPIATTLRNILTLGLTVGATATAWKYYETESEQMYAVNTTLSTVVAVVNLVGTIGMYSCLHHQFKNDNSEKTPLV